VSPAAGPWLPALAVAQGEAPRRRDSDRLATWCPKLGSCTARPVFSKLQCGEVGEQSLFVAVLLTPKALTLLVLQMSSFVMPNVRAKLPAEACSVSLVCEGAEGAAHQAYAACRSGSA
jgi:hypothetical protein